MFSENDSAMTAVVSKPNCFNDWNGVIHSPSVVWVTSGISVRSPCSANFRILSLYCLAVLVITWGAGLYVDITSFPSTILLAVPSPSYNNGSPASNTRPPASASLSSSPLPNQSKSNQSSPSSLSFNSFLGFFEARCSFLIFSYRDSTVFSGFVSAPAISVSTPSSSNLSIRLFMPGNFTPSLR